MGSRLKERFSHSMTFDVLPEAADLQISNNTGNINTRISRLRGDTKLTSNTGNLKLETDSAEGSISFKTSQGLFPAQHLAKDPHGHQLWKRQERFRQQLERSVPSYRKHPHGKHSAPGEEAGCSLLSAHSLSIPNLKRGRPETRLSPFRQTCQARSCQAKPSLHQTFAITRSSTSGNALTA
jgi:hypothetical protein